MKTCIDDLLRRVMSSLEQHYVTVEVKHEHELKHREKGMDV